jgi:sugar phosphate isomerase/epimerase
MYSRQTLAAIADAVQSDGLVAVQLSLANAGLEPLPDNLDRDTARRIGDVFREREITVAAVSGTFNAVHPDRRLREDGIRRVAGIAARCADLGTQVITLCTGTRDPENMWRYHAANGEAEAWRDLVETMQALTNVAAVDGVSLGFEPEVVNVIDTAEKARRLLNEVGHPSLGVVLDPANLIHAKDLERTGEVIKNAFDQIGDRIVLAHAKDVIEPLPGERECRRVAPTTGKVDFKRYLELLGERRYTGALIMHDLAEDCVQYCAANLRDLGAC